MNWAHTGLNTTGWGWRELLSLRQSGRAAQSMIEQDNGGNKWCALLVALCLLPGWTYAHGESHGPPGHHDPTYNSQQEYEEKIPVEYNDSWQRWHMAHEHGLDDFTPSAFFQLHAVTDPKLITKRDILRMYGLQRDEIVGQGDGMGGHDNSEHISPELKDRVVTRVLHLMDKDKNGVISMEEWLEFSLSGGEFPDFGLGPGHEYDFEEEYEKHHWLKYHAQDDPDVEIMHKEDIEHELLHHFHEIEHDHEESEAHSDHAHEEGGKPAEKYNLRLPVLTQNIPPSFRYAQ